jgi:hypothetical protein
MPVYFDSVAPTCPISTDSSTGPRQRPLFNHPIFIRPAIPRAFDFNSALNAANITRNIVQSLIYNKTVNNVRDNIGPGHKPPPGGSVSVAKDKFKNKKSRWAEQKDKRVKKTYKYYARDEDGIKNKEVWVKVERIVKMVWYDKAWKSYLTWEYNDPGDADVVSGVGGTSGDGSASGDSGDGG